MAQGYRKSRTAVNRLSESRRRKSRPPQQLDQGSEESKFRAATSRHVSNNKVVPALMKEFGYKNVMQVPKLERVVLNVGMGEAIQNVKLLESAVTELGTITGQKPVVTTSQKSHRRIQAAARIADRGESHAA